MRTILIIAIFVLVTIVVALLPADSGNPFLTPPSEANLPSTGR